MSQISYKEAGVDIEAGNESVNRIKPLVAKTFSSHVISELGGFGGLFDLKPLLEEYTHPVMVQSIDGVGTKTIVARMMHAYDTIGIDLVSATANDILVMGAKPLTLLDYIAAQNLAPEMVEALVRGMAGACVEHGIALVGGETAEMPGTYQHQEFDVAGIVTGVVEKNQIITGQSIEPGDMVYGVSSNGLHTNGYSLARMAFFDKAKLTVDTYLDELKESVGEALIKPHLNYAKPILKALEQGVQIKGMAHITGGGLIENIPRILPKHCGVSLKSESWHCPEVFQLIQEIGKLEMREMYRTFNMGIGLTIFVAPDEAKHLENSFQSFSGFKLQHIGVVHQKVHESVRIE